MDVPDVVRVSVNRFSTVFVEENSFSILYVVALIFPCAEYITAFELTTVPGTAVFNKFNSAALLVMDASLFNSTALAFTRVLPNFKPLESPS